MNDKLSDNTESELSDADAGSKRSSRKPAFKRKIASSESESDKDGPKRRIPASTRRNKKEVSMI